jgi:hypothetical protein
MYARTYINIKPWSKTDTSFQFLPSLRPGVHQGNWKPQLNFNTTANERYKYSQVIWRGVHVETTTATAAQLAGKLETHLRSNSACQFPVTWVPIQLYNWLWKKKYLEERNILFVRLIKQGPCLYDKCSPDYSSRDKTDLEWFRTAQEMKEKNERKRGEPSTSSFGSFSSSSLLTDHQKPTGSTSGGIAYRERKPQNYGAFDWE